MASCGIRNTDSHIQKHLYTYFEKNWSKEIMDRQQLICKQNEKKVKRLGLGGGGGGGGGGVVLLNELMFIDIP